MQSRIALPLRYGLKEQHKGWQLLPAQQAAVRWARVDDYQALLDLECGEGKLLQYYLNHFSVRACGMTRNPGECHDSLPSTAEIMRAAQHDIPWRNNSFDVVFFTRFNQRQQHNDLLFEEVNRVLKPGAQFIITLPGSLFIKRLAHLSTGSLAMRSPDNPFSLMETLNRHGFVDVSVRSSRCRHTTVIAHKHENTSN